MMYGADIRLSLSLRKDKMLIEAFIISRWKVQSGSYKISCLCFCNLRNS